VRVNALGSSAAKWAEALPASSDIVALDKKLSKRVARLRVGTRALPAHHAPAEFVLRLRAVFAPQFAKYTDTRTCRTSFARAANAGVAARLCAALNRKVTVMLEDSPAAKRNRRSAAAFAITRTNEVAAAWRIV